MQEFRVCHCKDTNRKIRTNFFVYINVMNHSSTFEFSGVFYIQNVLKRSLSQVNFVVRKRACLQQRVNKIDICGWWFLVKLRFVDVCGTKKSCIESMNAAYSYLSISIFKNYKTIFHKCWRHFARQQFKIWKSHFSTTPII